MNQRLARVFGFAFALLATHRAGAETLRVSAQVRPGTYYVGQAFELSVGVVAGRERPEVTTPRIAGAEVSFLGNDPLKPISAGGIGDVVFERNLFRFRYRMIARRAGPLTVPPVSARLDEEMGASTALTLQVRGLPLAGRTAEFLGGVGEFEVGARAEPAAIRSGQTLEYRVTVTGPAARGINGAPGLARLNRLPLGFEVERRPDEAVADPPSHTFVYRLRPTMAGEATLPPVAVAAFDPRSERYVTRLTSGIPVRVADVPRFQPESLDYGMPRRVLSRGWVASFVLGAVVLAAAWLTIRLARTRAVRAVRRIGLETHSRLERAGSEAERGQVFTEGLIAYLHVTTGRPPGALTPIEAEEGVVRATDLIDLARRANRLVAESDQARFGSGGVELGAAGLKFFGDLVAAPVVNRPARETR